MGMTNAEALAQFEALAARLPKTSIARVAAEALIQGHAYTEYVLRGCAWMRAAMPVD
jgi:hypothetical protein